MARFEEITLAKLEPHERNIRRELRDIDELAASIRAEGVLQALTVAPHATAKTKYVVLGGHRRLAAAKLVKLKTLPCMVREDLDSWDKQLRFMIGENTVRDDLTPTEEAEAYQMLLDLPDYTVKTIAEKTGRSQTLVKSRLKLNKLNTAQKKAVDTGQMSLERAITLAEFVDDGEASKALESKAYESASTWEIEVKRIQQRRAWQNRIPELRRELEAAGVKIIDRPAGNVYAWYPLTLVRNPVELTYQERIEGHQVAIVDDGPAVDGLESRIIWLTDNTARDAAREALNPRSPAKPEPDPEELADQERQANLEAGLRLAVEVRREHISKVLKEPTPDQARAALIGQIGLTSAGAWLGFPKETDDQEILDELGKLSLERLAVLRHVTENSGRAREMWQLHAWDPSSYYWTAVSTWIRMLSEVYGYELSDVERAAITYHQPPAVEPDPDTDDEQEQDDDAA